MNCSRVMSVTLLYPSQRTLAFQSTLDPGLQNTCTIHPFQGDNLITLLPDQSRNIMILGPPPRSLTLVACLAYDDSSSFMFTIPFTRRVASSCLVVPTYFLHLSLCFLWSNGKPLFWMCPWFSTLVVSPPVLAVIRFVHPLPLPTIPRYIFVFTGEKVTRLILQ